MAMMANNEPIPPLDSEENCIADTSVKAATDSAPCAKAAYFKWNDVLDLALASTVG